MLFILSETSTCTCVSTEKPVERVGNGRNGKWKEKCNLNGELKKETI